MKNFFKISFLLGILGIISPAYADTIINYMTIANNIPVMAMKPDDQSQAWVRSAQRILTSTDETLSQTVVSMNTVAAKQGHPVFCFPQGILFDANTVHDIIQKTYTELMKTQGAALSGMTISDVLMLGMVSRYSCSPTPASSAIESTQMMATPTPLPAAPSLGAQPAITSTTEAAPAPAMPATSSMGASLPAVSSSTPTEQPVMSNPYGTPPTQQVVSAELPPTL